MGFVNNWRRISFLCQVDLLLSAGPYNVSIWTVLGVTEEMRTAWVLIFPKKETQLEKQDGGQGKCPFGGQIFARQGKMLSWLSSFDDNAPGLLSTRCKFGADRLNPGWASLVNASHRKVSNFWSDCIFFAVLVNNSACMFFFRDFSLQLGRQCWDPINLGIFRSLEEICNRPASFFARKETQLWKKDGGWDVIWYL